MPFARILVVTEEERDRIKRMLTTTEVYTKKSLVAIIAQGRDPTQLQPEERENAILFCDIRRFTTMAERMRTIDVVGFLNSFFSRMNTVIQAHDGEIDKLIGDCIMASFPSRERALACSVEMRRSLQSYNGERRERNLEPVRVGIGISYGRVIIGNIGSRNKMDFTLIGDIVNVSSRLESLTKTYGLDILTSIRPGPESSPSGDHRFVDAVRAKGRDEPIEVYELFDHEPERFREFKKANRERYDEAYLRYRRADFDGAAAAYRALIREAGPHSHRAGLSADPLLDFYERRCAALAEDFKIGRRHESAWDGIHTVIA